MKYPRFIRIQSTASQPQFWLLIFPISVHHKSANGRCSHPKPSNPGIHSCCYALPFRLTNRFPSFEFRAPQTTPRKSDRSVLFYYDVPCLNFLRFQCPYLILSHGFWNKHANWKRHKTSVSSRETKRDSCKTLGIWLPRKQQEGRKWSSVEFLLFLYLLHLFMCDTISVIMPFAWK